MPEPIVYLLLALALALPVPGAAVLRLFDGRLGQRGVALGAAVLFGLAIASALLLSRSDVGLLRIGDVSLLLPGTHASDSFSLPADIVDPGLPAAPLGPPTLTPRPSATAAATATATAAATATAEPATAEPATPAPAPPAARRYKVAPGDSLRSIAEKFGVAVEALLQANGLTPAQGDALRVGQELIIP
jgi:pyruvate/2-oxoglutarate dehydrogenase complex dihydrolipoamide acyltransferase (E2) component